MARRMSLKVAQEAFAASNLLLNPSFQSVLEYNGYVVNEEVIDSMLSKAALVIAKDAIKKAGLDFSKVLIGAPIPEKSEA